MLRPNVSLGETDVTRLQQLDNIVASNKSRKDKAMSATVRMDENGQLHLGKKSRKKAWALRTVYKVLQFIPYLSKKVNRAINDIQIKNEHQQAEAVKWLNSLPKANPEKSIQLADRSVTLLTERKAVTLEDTCLFVNQRLQSNQLTKDHHKASVPDFTKPETSALVFRNIPDFDQDV